MAKQVLHNVKGMFHKRTHRGFDFLSGLEGFFFRPFFYRFDLAAFARDLPVNLPFQGHHLRSFLHAL